MDSNWLLEFLMSHGEELREQQRRQQQPREQQSPELMQDGNYLEFDGRRDEVLHGTPQNPSLAVGFQSNGGMQAQMSLSTNLDGDALQRESHLARQAIDESTEQTRKALIEIVQHATPYELRLLHQFVALQAERALQGMQLQQISTGNSAAIAEAPPVPTAAFAGSSNGATLRRSSLNERTSYVSGGQQQPLGEVVLKGLVGALRLYHIKRQSFPFICVEIGSLINI